MKEQIANALKGLGEVSVTSVLPAFEGCDDLIARGTVKKANQQSVAAFKHSSLTFSFDRAPASAEDTYSFSVYFHPSALSASEHANSPTDKTAKPSTK